MATQAEVAEHLDLSQQAVSDLVRRGVIPPAPRGEYDLAACRVAYLRHMRAQAETGGNALTGERVRRTRMQAERLEHENEKRRADLIPRGDVEAVIEAGNDHARTLCLEIPGQVASKCATEKNPAAVKKILTNAVHSTLRQLASTKVVATRR